MKRDIAGRLIVEDVEPILNSGDVTAAPAWAQQLLDGQQRLSAQLAQLQDQLGIRRPLPGDDAVMTALLPVIGARYGSEVFLVSDLTVDPRFKRQISGLNNKQLGRVFLRNEHRVFGTRCISRSKADDGSLLWHVLQVYKAR